MTHFICTKKKILCIAVVVAAWHPRIERVAVGDERLHGCGHSTAAWKMCLGRCKQTQLLYNKILLLFREHRQRSTLQHKRTIKINIYFVLRIHFFFRKIKDRGKKRISLKLKNIKISRSRWDNKMRIILEFKSRCSLMFAFFVVQNTERSLFLLFFCQLRQ